jgi:hypothetical protein
MMSSENRFALFGIMLLRGLFLGGEHRAKPVKVKRYRQSDFIAALHNRVVPGGS